MAAGGATPPYDLAILGATPAGIFAALTAARRGRRVVLVARGQHVGGLLTSGLSIANIRHRHIHGGPFDEFSRAVVRTYVDRHGPNSPIVRETRGGTWWEPHVAEAVFEQLLATQPSIVILRNYRLHRVFREGQRVTGFAVQDRATGHVQELHAAVSIDATYEGDLAAAAGIPYRVGRESRDEFWEPHAGHILFSRQQEVLPGSTGGPDRRIQAFCYRLTVTQDPARRVPFPPPQDFRREDYAHILEAASQGRVSRLLDVMLLGPERVRVNGKADVIANLVGGADDYPDASEAERERIERRHKDYTLGLFHLLQHDPAIPQAVREEALSWGLAADEFADNGHFPYELYVREARRIHGRATATEHDFLLASGKDRSPLHDDAVAVADYVIDTHSAQVIDTPPYEEGHLNVRATVPGQVRFGSLVPIDQNGVVSGLLVPVALASTHLGFAVIRMEPVWMALGAVAATAACLAIDRDTTPDALPLPTLQAALAREDHRLAFFHDVPLDLRSPGLQFLAARGAFDTFYARPHDPLTRAEAARWITLWLDLTGHQPPAAPPSPPFLDLLPDHPDYPAVERLRTLGIVDPWLDSTGFFPSAYLRSCDAARWLGTSTPAARPYAPITRLELCDQLFTAFASLIEQ